MGHQGHQNRQGEDKVRCDGRGVMAGCPPVTLTVTVKPIQEGERFHQAMHTQGPPPPSILEPAAMAKMELNMERIPSRVAWKEGEGGGGGGRAGLRRRVCGIHSCAIPLAVVVTRWYRHESFGVAHFEYRCCCKLTKESGPRPVKPCHSPTTLPCWCLPSSSAMILVTTGRSMPVAGISHEIRDHYDRRAGVPLCSS